MNSEWPWHYLWLFMTNESNKLRISEMTLANLALGRHHSTVDTTKAKQWEYGSDFKTKQAKYRAKCTVMGELEKRSGKGVLKAQAILSGIVTELCYAALY